MNIKKKYDSLPIQMKASFWFLVCSFLQKGISFITTPIFTRILTTAEYGEFSVFNSWMLIISPVISLKLYAGVYAQGVVKFDEDRWRFSSSLQGLSLTLILGWTGLYLIFHDAFNSLFSLTTAQMLCMFVIIWATGSFSFWSMNKRVDFRYRELVLLTLVVSIVQPTLSIILIQHSEDKVTARILGMAITQFAFYVGTFIAQMREGKTFCEKKYWTYALRFNIPLLPHYLSMTVLNSSDRIMIKNMVGSSQAGIYNLAYSVSMIMSLFNNALLQTVEPWIYRKLKDKKGDELEKVAYPSFIMIAGANLLLILLAPEVIRIFAPAKYYDAIWVVPSVALSVFFMYMYSFFATFEFYYEKTRYIAGATIGGAVLNIVLNYIFIRMYGYLAAGYTTLFSYILFALLHYHFMRKICREDLDDLHPYKAKLIIAISVVSIALGFGIMALYEHPIARYTILAALAAAAIAQRKKIWSYAGQFMNMRNRNKRKTGGV